MARKHYWQFLVTDEGNPIENAQISIYIAGTENDAYVYTDEIGSAFSQKSPQTVTSRKGYFEFWVADENDPNGYPLSTKFKIEWVAPGVSKGFIDYVDVFSTSWEPVNVNDVNEIKNKAVSNLLAKGWEDHKNSILPLNNPHDLGPVNEFDVNGDRNRVVSNYQSFIWDNHVKNSWDLTLNGDGQYIADDVNPIERMHGIKPVDETVTGLDKNKLISNTLAKSWTDHIDEDNPSVATIDHPQFSLINGTRYYTNAVGYNNSNIVSTINGNDFVTKSYIDEQSYKIRISDVDWNVDGGVYSYEVIHSLNIHGVTYPVVEIWVWDGTVYEKAMPLDVVSVDVNTIKLYHPNNDDFVWVRVSV